MTTKRRVHKRTNGEPPRRALPEQRIISSKARKLLWGQVRRSMMHKRQDWR